MEILQLVADGAGADEDEYCLGAGVGSDESETYVNFQRYPEYGLSEDWGIYFEFNGQANSGYNKIASCKLSRSELHVSLTEPLDYEGRYNGVTVALNLNDKDYNAFVMMLQRIFVGFESLIFIK